MNKVVTFTSDFGDDFAKGQIKVVVKSINPNAEFVTVSNQVTPFSILEGAFILNKFTQFSSKGSIHIGVVDPGVGTNRRGLIIKTKDFYFVGPDNGLFYPAASRNGIEKVYMISEEKLGDSLSNTFHGRDIFAKVAAYLSQDKDSIEFADEIDSSTLIKLDFKKNQVVHIDAYGNIKVNNSAEDFKFGDNLQLTINNEQLIIAFVRTFEDVKKGELLAYKGSHQILEIAENLGSANKRLNLNIGDIIEIEKEVISI